MSQNEKEYVFLGSQELSGISEKNNRPYELYKISFADPVTFENHTLSYKKGLNLNWLNKGDRIYLHTDLIAGFGNRDSSTLVVDVKPTLVIK